MDSLLTAAARALAAGDVITALGHVALRTDPPALALRGIAMAQLGELERARGLLRQAWRGFDRSEGVARARCVVAEAETALALRDLSGSTAALRAAAITLSTHGDSTNALQAWLILARRALLLGQREQLGRALARLQGMPLPPALAAMAALTEAAWALRELRVQDARAALAQAAWAAEHAGIASLQAEVAAAARQLEQPAARRRVGRSTQPLDLQQVRDLLNGKGCVIDGCRHDLWRAGTWRSLARRPLLFALLRMLGQAWPADVPRDVLIAELFHTRYGDETHRARLRVEVGRLRVLLRGWLDVTATASGYRLQVPGGAEVVVLAPPMEGEPAAVAALLADGAAWSTSALARVLGISQRGVQRALAALAEEGRVRARGAGRAQRWMATPLSGFTTILLLPVLLPGD